VVLRLSNRWDYSRIIVDNESLRARSRIKAVTSGSAGNGLNSFPFFRPHLPNFLEPRCSDGAPLSVSRFGGVRDELCDQCFCVPPGLDHGRAASTPAKGFCPLRTTIVDLRRAGATRRVVPRPHLRRSWSRGHAGVCPPPFQVPVMSHSSYCMSHSAVQGRMVAARSLSWRH
jgi:hypothetical protein